jgi:hypothetical protein
MWIIDLLCLAASPFPDPNSLLSCPVPPSKGHLIKYVRRIDRTRSGCLVGKARHWQTRIGLSVVYCGGARLGKKINRRKKATNLPKTAHWNLCSLVLPRICMLRFILCYNIGYWICPLPCTSSGGREFEPALFAFCPPKALESPMGRSGDNLRDI